MGKKRSWFSFVKRLFIPETKSKVEKKTNSWGWMFGGLKFKQYPEIAAPQKSLCEATEEQRKHVLAVAIATAAAAEAAVAAANAAAEVVKLTSISPDRKRKRNLAALRIQSAYRRHLAKKALNALKGLVKLQAVIRGELVRRKVIPKLKCMQSLVSAPNICHIRVPLADIDTSGCKRRQTPENMIESQEFRLHDRNKSWDFSSVSKEEMEDLWFKRQEAVAKRERMKRYSYSHREKRNDQMLQESIKKENGKQNSSRFNQVEMLESGERERLKSFSYITDDMNKMLQIKLNSTATKQDSLEMPNSPYSLPRRSFCHVKQRSIGDDISLPNSPAFPTYMASTESAKAKARSISTPKQRLLLFSESSYAGQHSPCKFRISPWSSFNGEMSSSSSSRKTVLPQSQQIYI